MKNETNEPLSTYADYLTWKIEERIEIIKGKIFKMTSAPATKHQQTSGLIARKLYIFFDLKSACKVFVAPFGVRLIDNKNKSTADEDIITVFQPDLCVICNEKKLDDRGCIGAPDLIIEILSLGNSSREMKNKFELYEENGVQEYWIVDYVYKTIFMYVLENDKYIGLKPLTEEETLISKLFPNLSFKVSEVFNE